MKEHPEWFHHRPDGSIAYAENPPKQYQDIYPINFWPDETGTAWRCGRRAGRSCFWIGLACASSGSTTPTPSRCLLGVADPRVQAVHPEVVFLAEAFTRPG